jgi:thiol:disulfide interchange protein DsbD
MLLVAALYYLKTLVPVLGRLTGTTPGFIGACAAAVVLGLLLGAVHLSFQQGALRALRKAGGIALVTVGLFGLTNYLLTPKLELTWRHSEPEAVAAAKASGRPLLIDFTAEWCLPCKELEVNIFADPRVAQLMQERFTLLKIDCTREDEDPRITKQRERYQAEGLPAVRVVAPDGKVLAKLDHAAITPEEFLKLLADAL